MPSAWRRRPLRLLWPFLAALFLGFLDAPVRAQNGLESPFARKAPRLDGVMDWGEWDGAARIDLERGFVALRNDHTRLYLLVDMTGLSEPDPNDQLWLTFDVDGDGAITPNRDVNYALEAETRNLRYQYYEGPSRWTDLQPLTCSTKAEHFSASLADQTILVDPPRFVQSSPHRVWEVAIDLAEIGARPGGRTRLGVRVASPRAQYVEEKPARFTDDFRQLIEVNLAAFGRVPDGGALIDAKFKFPGDPIEVTQAIQTRLNALPLVQGKPTVARVYVDMSDATEPQPVLVCLYGKRGSQDLPGSPLQTFATVPPMVDRARLNDTPVFLLPDSWTEGTVTLRATIRHVHFGDTMTGPVTVTFSPKRVPTYWIVPLNYGSASSPTVASATEIASQQSYLKALFPLPDVHFVVKPWTAIGTVTASNPMSLLNDYYDQVVLGWALAFLFTGQPPFDLPRQVYGFRPSGGGLSDPVWCAGRGYVAWGFRGTSLEGTMAHEINHNLDRDATGTWGRHTPFGCGATGPDSAWPYSNVNIQEVGVDVRPPLNNNSAMAVTFPDVMGYCQSGTTPTKWISPYRWNSLFNVFPAPASPLAPSSDEQVTTVYYLSGVVNRDGSGRLNPVLTQPGLPTDTIARGDYAIELADADGGVVQSIPFMVMFEDVEGNPIDAFNFNYQIPAREGVSEIILRHGRTILDTLKASRAAPVVTVREPNGGEFWKDQGRVSWIAQDEDRDPLTFTIQYSPNDGATWIPIANGVRGEGLDVDATALPGGKSARIRVLATDGFHTGEDDSDRPFVVETKPPQPLIVRPLPDAPLVAGDFLTFETDGGDLEDGVVPDLSCFWSYRGQIFGLGRKVEACLPPGNHEVRLTVVDSEDRVSEILAPSRVAMSGHALYLNCGGANPVVDAAGRTWIPADPFLAFGHPAVTATTGAGAVDTQQLSDALVPSSVLETAMQRDGGLDFQVPVTPGEYRVALYFSENNPASVGPRFGGTGCAQCARVFDVLVEGRRRTGWNPADAALPPANDGTGGVLTASELQFDVAVKDGVLDIRLLDLGAGNPPGDPAIQAIAIRNLQLGRLHVRRNRDGSLTLTWPLGIGGVLQVARDVPGPYKDSDAPVRREDENAAVDIPADGPGQFFRLMLAP